MRRTNLIECDRLFKASNSVTIRGKFWLTFKSPEIFLILFKNTRCLAAESVFWRCRPEYCTTTGRSKHLCKFWSTFWELWDFIKISLFLLFRSPSLISDFTNYTISASRWTFAKSASQSEHFSKREWSSLSCSQMNHDLRFRARR